MLFYVPPERREILRAKLSRLLCVPFSFSNRGSHVVVYEPEEAFDKALAVRRNEIYRGVVSKEILGHTDQTELEIARLAARPA